MTIADIASLLALAVSAGALYISWRKAPHENRKSDADASKTFEEGAALAAERANRLEARIALLEKHIQKQDARIEHLEKEVEEKDELIKDRDNSIDLLKEWAEMLVNQVKEFGGDPVKMPERKSRSKAVPQ